MGSQVKKTTSPREGGEWRVESGGWGGGTDVIAQH